MEEKMSIKKFLKKSLLLIIFMQLFHATSNLFAGFVLRDLDSWNLLWWTTLLSGVFVFMFIMFLNGMKVKSSIRQLKLMFVVNAASFVGAASLFKAFETNITISGVISLLSSPVIFLIAIIFSKIRPELLEHHTRKIYFIRGVG